MSELAVICSPNGVCLRGLANGPRVNAYTYFLWSEGGRAKGCEKGGAGDCWSDYEVCEVGVVQLTLGQAPPVPGA